MSECGCQIYIEEVKVDHGNVSVGPIHIRRCPLHETAQELLERLEDARTAIASLHPNALGYATDGIEGWPIKTELLGNIDATIARAREVRQGPMTDDQCVANDICAKCGHRVFFGSLLCGSCSAGIKAEIKWLKEINAELVAALEELEGRHSNVVPGPSEECDICHHRVGGGGTLTHFEKCPFFVLYKFRETANYD
jgi:hypothetical protein